MSNKPATNETLLLSPQVLTSYDGNTFLEFFVTAIPCYLFFVSFFIRYMAIKDLGFPKRVAFGYILTFKILLTFSVIVVRLM
jgi:hypothetical protein